MKKLITLIAVLTVAIFAFGQNENPVIMTIDGENVFRSEFVYIYTKNEDNPSFKKSKLDDYMELFINYKLKVKEAEQLKYDTIPALQTELLQYRDQLSRPYMTDEAKNEDLVKEAYDRTINEIRASHILIRVDANANQTDTLEAYKKAIKLRKQIINGSDFAEVAKKNSGDPSAKFNGGDLGYFTALQMKYSFEDIAFKTNIGEVTMPVRTSFGFHIIKVTDKRKSKGKMKAAHIMIASTGESSEEEQLQAKEKIDEIYELLKNGEKFEDLAIKYSDDRSSNSKGGVLPTFGAGTNQRIVTEFETAAFNLENDEDYSVPISTRYGWHIIKRISLEPMSSYDEMHRELKLKVERDVRVEKSKMSFVNSLKKEYNLRDDYEKSQVFLESEVKDDILKGNWKGFSTDDANERMLFNFADKVYSIGDFEKYLLKNQKETPNKPVYQYLKDQYKTFIIEELTAYEDSQLEKKHPDFKSLMQEYRDGILVFEIMQNEIWQKAAQDSVGIKNYYESHKDNFSYPIRYKGDLYKCKDKATALKVFQMVAQDTLEPMEIRKIINKDSQLNLSMKSHTFNSQTTDAFRKGKLKEPKPGKNKKHKVRKFKKGINKIFERNGDYYVFEVEEVYEPRPRKYEEAKGLVTAAYQNQLEEEWLATLRKKYSVIVNKEILYGVGKM